MNSTVTNGYPNYPYGLLGFWADSQDFWLDSLKELIWNEIPIIVLMHYSPNGTDDGHFRVVTGYDDNEGVIYMNDPWAYDDNPHVAVWTYAEFKEGWNYLEQESPRTNPYFGSIALPLWLSTDEFTEIDPYMSYLRVSASLPELPEPFHNDQFELTDVLITINYDINQMTINGSQSFFYDSFSDVPFAPAQFYISCYEVCDGKNFTVELTAVVRSFAYPTYCCNTTNGDPINYPEYKYRDVLGGSAWFAL